MQYKKMSKIALVTMGLMLLNGCNGNGNGQGSNTKSISGTVVNGPGGTAATDIVGATVSLYQTGSSTPLGSATTNQQGSFNINYPASLNSGTYLYLVAQRGEVGQNNNPNINLINVIGTEGNIANGVVINEMTTVAAYQSFTNDWNITGSQPALTPVVSNTKFSSADGMAVSFATYQGLVNSVTGNSNYAVSTNTGGQMAAQANMLASCVQNAAVCTSLASVLSTSQSDTLSLMAGLKQASSTVISGLNSLISFSPYTSVPLTQSALSIEYAVAPPSANISPQQVTVDNANNIWVTNRASDSVTEFIYNSVNGFSAANSQTFPNILPPSESPAPEGISADSSGNIWIGNDEVGTSTIAELVNNGNNSYTPEVLTATVSPLSINTGTDVDVDNQDNVWIGNYSTVFSELLKSNGYNPNNARVIGSSTLPYLEVPKVLTHDSHDDIWIGNIGQATSNGVIEYINDGNGNYTAQPFDSNTFYFNHPSAISVDAADNIWIGNTSYTSNNNSYENSVTELLNVDGGYPSAINFGSNNGFTNFSTPQGISSDALGHIWVANSTNNTVVELFKNPTTGTYDVAHQVIYASNNSHTSPYPFNYPHGITVDAGGNVWVVQQGQSSVVEMIN